jgi:hypothetical protein
MKGDADATRSPREDAPVMVRLRAARKAQRQHGGELALLLISLEKVGIIFIVPGLGIEKCDTPFVQEVNESWEVRVATKQLL